MGKSQSNQDKAEELREVTRAANEALKDVQRAMKNLQEAVRDIDKLVAAAFDEHIAAHAARAEQVVSTKLGEFSGKLVKHSNTFQEVITNRWGYIEAMAVCAPNIAHMIALHVLKDAGGTIKTDNAEWHVVREKPQPDGTSMFAFPKSMGDKAKEDPRIEKAIRRAVNAHRPDIDLLAWPTAELKGSDEE